MLKELTSRINHEYYQAAVKRIKVMHPSCDNDDAWNQAIVEKYQKCTYGIVDSSRDISYNIKAIVFYAANKGGAKSIEAEFDEVLEDVEFEPNPSKAFNQVMKFITDAYVSSSETLSCFKIDGCLEKIREVVIRLKMIQWGLYGLGQVPAGLLVATHNVMLGPYFGDLGGANWPHIPLYKKPTKLEEDFNQLLTNITYVMSSGTLKNVSLLDLPAFGSTIGTLRKSLKKHFNWPVETNHAIRTSNTGVNFSDIFTSYKTLVEDWGHHMKLLRKKDDMGQFTSEMKNNRVMNFTEFIEKDMDTFLIAILGIFFLLFLFIFQKYFFKQVLFWKKNFFNDTNSKFSWCIDYLSKFIGSFPTTLKGPLSIWYDVAKLVFNQTKKEEFVKARGVYDKIIIDCAFKENLQRKKQPSIGGCDDFVPSITTNGLCYTFNGQNSSEIWKSSKMMTTFSHLFPSQVKNKKKFGGTRTVQGKEHNILKKYTYSRAQNSTYCYYISPM